jgi:phosphoglycolate phosphatase
MATILIFDVDNTLYNFVDFFGPSFRSMVHALSKKTKLEEGIIIESARKVYQQVGTLEYQFLIQNMDIFKGREQQDIEALALLAQKVFFRTRRKNLELYDGIEELMRSAKEAGCKCVCLTNAPFYQVQRRISDLKIMDCLDGLVAWEGSNVDRIEPFPERRESARVALKKRLSFFCTLADHERKPSSSAFSRIMSSYGPSAKYVSLGDTASKDLEPAKKLGMMTILAKYGQRVSQNNLNTLLQVTPWTDGEIKASMEQLMEPDWVADSAEDVMRILGIPRRMTQGKLL